MKVLPPAPLARVALDDRRTLTLDEDRWTLSCVLVADAYGLGQHACSMAVVASEDVADIMRDALAERDGIIHRYPHSPRLVQWLEQRRALMVALELLAEES